MQEDLTTLRFFIERHYKKTVEEDALKRADQLQYNFMIKSKQSQKMISNIKKL